MPPQNTTLPTLMAGQHNLTLIEMDTTGNTCLSQNVQFAITNPTPTPTTQVVSSQTQQMPVLVLVLVLLAVGCYLGIFVYLTVRKKKL